MSEPARDAPGPRWPQGASHFLAARSRRERVLLAVVAALLLLALLLNLGILPAWRRLQAAPQEQARLDAQWQRMQGLQAQSAALLKQPRREFNEMALRSSLAPLGETAQLQLSAPTAELTLRGARPEAVAAWLLASRAEAGVVVRQAHLERSAPEGPTLWSGRLLLELPR